MDDVRKTGYLKKLKTMKKKFFILRGESDAGPARLEYHDSEKKWKLGTPPKRVIHLKTCFNINRKLDTKHKWVIALYTKDDCFAMSFECENELDAWLTTLLELQHGDEWLGINEKPKPNFEHVWEVNVKNKGLGSSKGILGPYRLCLTERMLSLVQMSANEPLIYEFPMMSIRRCGHSESFFFMEVGRSTTTGAGELWMLTEDTLIAQNMHEAILNAMKSSNSKEDIGPKARIRSQSAANESSKPISSHARRQTFNVIAPHTAMNDARVRCDSMPTRPRTVSDGHKEAGASARSNPGGFGADSGAGNSSSAAESSGGHQEMLLTKDGPLEPSIEEEGPAYISMSTSEAVSSGQEGYMEMQPCRNIGYSPTSPLSGRSTFISHTDRSTIVSPPSWMTTHNQPPTSIPVTADYLEMSSVTTATHTAVTLDGYMPMSPIGSLLTHEVRVKENMNGGHSKVDQDCVDGYVPMAPLTDSLPQSLKSFSPPEDEGYMDMAPLSRGAPRGNNLEASVDLSSRRSSDSPSTDMCFAEYPLDKVQAYFTPSEEEEPMVRACSIGSRTDCNVKNNRLEVTSDSCRTRAFSVGSGVKRGGGVGSRLGYGTQRGKVATGKLYTVTGETNGNEVVNGAGSAGKKSMSAPVLGTSPLLNNIWQTNGISCGKKPNNNEDLMEMDFPESQTTVDHRRSSSSLSGRPRANSKSSHIRMSSKPDSAQQQKKSTSDQTMKGSDYLVMEASLRKLTVTDEVSSSADRKCSLPIAITESSSEKENRRSSELALSSIAGEYVNIDPSRSFEYRSSPASAKLSTVNVLSHRPTSSSAVKFNPEYVNLHYGLESAKVSSIEEEKSGVGKPKPAPLATVTKSTDETESDYTVMAPGYPLLEAAESEKLSPTFSCNDVGLSAATLKSNCSKSTSASTTPDDDSQDGGQRQLNYAALDLPPSTATSFDESEAKNSTASPTNLSRGSPTTTPEEGTAFSNPITTPITSLYAQIDFAKSEGLRSQTQNSLSN